MRNPSKSSSAAPTVAGEGGSRSGSATNNSKTTSCCSKVGMKRGPWTPEEDELLANYIRREGEGRWRTLPKRAGLLRCGKSCRLRWMNYLRPSVKRGHIAPDEEDLILRLHRLLGNRWSLIAGRIPGRTDNEIKNYWNTHLSKKLISQGIDPRTHKPINPSSFSSAHHRNKASSSKPNHNPNPKPNYVPSNSGLEEPVGGIVVKGGNNDDDDDDEYESGTLGNFVNVNLQNSDDGSPIDDMNNCSDDVFSSFLNSLINEDLLSSQNQVQQHLANGSDVLISSSLGAGWNAPIMSSESAFNQNDPKRLN